MYTYCVCLILWMPGEGAASTEIGVADGSTTPCGHWKLNSDSLKNSKCSYWWNLSLAQTLPCKYRWVFACACHGVKIKIRCQLCKMDLFFRNLYVCSKNGTQIIRLWGKCVFTYWAISPTPKWAVLGFRDRATKRCSPGWPQAHRILPASISWVPVLSRKCLGIIVNWHEAQNPIKHLRGGPQDTLESTRDGAVPQEQEEIKDSYKDYTDKFLLSSWCLSAVLLILCYTTVHLRPQWPLNKRKTQSLLGDPGLRSPLTRRLMQAALIWQFAQYDYEVISFYRLFYFL